MPENPPPLPPSRRRPARWPWILLLTLFVITVGIIPGFYLEEKIRGKLAWHAYERDAQKRGVKLAFSDYLPPPIPDSENFASIPIFDAAFQASEAKQPTPNPFELFSNENKKRPIIVDPVTQQTVDFVAWQKFFVETKRLPKETVDATADVLTALDGFAEPLAQLREAGARPHCRFPVHWEKGYMASLPQFGLITGAGRIYALRLTAHLARGENAAAYEDFRAGLRLITATGKEPSLIAGLVRASVAATMLNAVWGGLARQQWTESELEKIQADLSGLDWLEDYCFAMGSERGGANGMFDMVIDHPHELDDLYASGDPGMRRTLNFYPTGWFYHNKVRMNRFMDEILTRFDPAQHRYFGERPVPSSPSKIKAASMPVKIYYALFTITASVFESVDSRFVQIGAMTDEARIACALERFRLVRGNYPDRLDELSPQFLSSLPHEIVNGEPYHYRRADDGRFVLYSVGMDLKDDGGIIDPKLKATKQKDWVWRYPAQ
jgi:hypothetical protein